MRCPCRKKSELATYAECCEPFHLDRQGPATAEALMRSRYAAFVVHNAAYLLATWHPSTRPAATDFTPDQEWQLLRIIAAETSGEHATVEFKARSRIAGRSDVLHETSRFIRERDQWLYVDGDIH